eukprot:SAG31_NODE_5874_length_2279_cov_4.474312_1_plen_21_part_10
MTPLRTGITISSSPGSAATFG